MDYSSSKALVLASASPFRKAVLEKVISHFRCVSPEIDETPKRHESPDQLVMRLGRDKAQAVFSQYTLPEHPLIIASDQVAVFDNQILGKPHTRDNACRQLARFSGQAVDFFTSLCVLDGDSLAHALEFDHTRVYFRHLSDQDIENYINREMPLNCAGSFKSEGAGMLLFERIESDDPNALIGLPVIKLHQLLRQFGYNALAA